MPRKFAADYADDIIALYKSGMSCMAIGEKLNVNAVSASKIVKAAGITRPFGATRAASQLAWRNSITPEIVDRFSRGESVLAIGKSMGVNRSTIWLCLDAAGIKPRSGSDANLIRFASLTPDQRRDIAIAANVARRGSKASAIEMSRKAITKESSLSKEGEGERELVELLRARGVDCHMQYAVGGYNVDVFCRPVAVEVHSQTCDPHRNVRLRKRIKDLLDRDVGVIYIKPFVWRDGARIFIPYTEATIDYIVSFRQRAEADPTFRRQYRMIGSTGELTAMSGGNLDKVTVIPVPRRRNHAA